jgi:ABC-type ATPase with predicted acetyltransferase domain
MPCKLRKRKDDIPKARKEHSWECETCGALMISTKKPVCRQAMLAQVQARHASAEAEAAELKLDEKERK